jgi:hypothetical protein
MVAAERLDAEALIAGEVEAAGARVGGEPAARVAEGVGDRNRVRGDNRLAEAHETLRLAQRLAHHKFAHHDSGIVRRHRRLGAQCRGEDDGGERHGGDDSAFGSGCKLEGSRRAVLKGKVAPFAPPPL